MHVTFSQQCNSSYSYQIRIHMFIGHECRVAAVRLCYENVMCIYLIWQLNSGLTGPH